MDRGIQFPELPEKDKQKSMMESNDNNRHIVQEKVVVVDDDDDDSRTADVDVVQAEEEPVDDNHWAIVPRQFLNMGPNSLVRRDKVSSCSADERMQSGSRVNNVDGKNAGRKESLAGESVLQVQSPNKISRLKPTFDQSFESDIKNHDVPLNVRVLIRLKSEENTIRDGCQWRKYGEKLTKANPSPRAYYKCSCKGTNCPARKVVQRCPIDSSILVATYKGAHNHPLPPAGASMVPAGSISASILIPTHLLDMTQPSSSHLNHGTISPQQLLQILGHQLYNQLISSGLQFSQGSSSSSLSQASGYTMQQLHHVPTADIATAIAAASTEPNFPAMLAAARSSIAEIAQPNNNVTSADSVSAATAAAITADPNFPFMLAAALRTITDGAQPNNNVTNGAKATSPTNSKGKQR